MLFTHMLVEVELFCKTEVNLKLRKKWEEEQSKVLRSLGTRTEGMLRLLSAVGRHKGARITATMGKTTTRYYRVPGFMKSSETFFISEDVESDMHQANHLKQALFQVISHGSNEELKELLSMGTVDLNARNKEAKTPLMVAAMNNDRDKVKLLIASGADLDLQDDLGTLNYFKKLPIESSYALIQRSLFASGETALMLAAQQNHAIVVNELIEAGAQLDIKNYEEMTATELTLNNDIDALIRKKNDPYEAAKENGKLYKWWKED